MSNSSLVSYTRISPNRNSPRSQPIRKITLHHMAGNMSLEAFGALVAKSSRQMSANYAIDTDGNIGLFCPEADRSWCSSSRANDQQAITVEIANDGGAPDWHVSDAALEAAIRLCVDVCQRNGMPGLTWTGDSSGTLTCHYMFTATACPGPYLKGKMAWIAAEVNRRLAAGQGAAGDTGALVAGAELHLTRCPLYVASTSTSAAGTVTGTYWLWDDEQIGGRVRITNQADRVGQAGQVTGWINASDACAALGGAPAEEQPETPELHKLSISLPGADADKAAEIIRKAAELGLAPDVTVETLPASAGDIKTLTEMADAAGGVAAKV